MGLLTGKYAVITGAASPRGLGKATAKLYAEHGATVAILDLDAGAAQAAAADLPGEGHVGLACDVTTARHAPPWPRNWSRAGARSTCWSTMPASPSR
ncbi:3-oxoacyl-[acyl-carrier protein] reductase [Limimaricola cinnabarinus LL-001]|uniref:3-oxoacyl-[acyl-carrier protein] reductase n=1 Tax=Limimaricola cinnabarinus LL-001 TaxID=1337093 RepID=U3AI76_9RHOB|nr:3-oxoacyl-[acyl-carrier protein] reductase [Limimaricola cinnabarinus LL-001]